ncbi:3739_t:CDS:1, partial [Funneliformis geosporum]
LQNNENKYKPGFQCTCENISSKIESYPSTAFNSCYKKVFGTKTEYSGIAVIGVENEKIISNYLTK